MKKTITAVLGMMLLGGCAMKEFSSTPLYSGHEVKFTGRVEDRINLWPAAYWREPVGSIAWPLISWGDDHLAFRPVYSQYRQGGSGSGDYDEFNVLWPVGQFDTRHDDYRFFPFFWGESRGGDEPYFCLFPLLWWNRDFAGVMPFFWDRSGSGNEMGFCVFPLFWSEVKSSGRLWNTLFPLYYYQSNEEQFGSKGQRIMASGSKFWAFCGLAGYNRLDGKFTDHRFLPFYLYDNGDFYSLPYSRYRSGGRYKSRILLGFAGWDSTNDGEYRKSWLFPLYYHDQDELVTPLFGKCKDDDSSWLLPIYYNDRDAFLTPLFGKTKDADWLIPFYYHDESKFLTPLGGKSGDANWVLPLYWRDSENFASLPYIEKRGKDGEVDSAFSLPILSGYERDHKTGDRLLYMFLGLGGHVWNDETGGALRLALPDLLPRQGFVRHADLRQVRRRRLADSVLRQERGRRQHDSVLVLGRREEGDEGVLLAAASLGRELEHEHKRIHVAFALRAHRREVERVRHQPERVGLPAVPPREGPFVHVDPVRLGRRRHGADEHVLRVQPRRGALRGEGRRLALPPLQPQEGRGLRGEGGVA